MDLREVFATNLRRLRHEKGLSQDDLAYEAEISRIYLAQLEKGVYYASLKIVGQLADALRRSRGIVKATRQAAPQNLTAPRPVDNTPLPTPGSSVLLELRHPAGKIGRDLSSTSVVSEGQILTGPQFGEPVRVETVKADGPSVGCWGSSGRIWPLAAEPEDHVPAIPGALFGQRGPAAFERRFRRRAGGPLWNTHLAQRKPLWQTWP